MRHAIFVRHGATTLIAMLTLLACPATGAEKMEALAVGGTWRIEDLVLDIFDCRGLVCGRVVWIKDAARRPTECGRTIVWGLSPTSPGQWKDGWILDPDDDKTYSLSAILQSNGTLRARIFRGIELIGKTKLLRRVDVNSLLGRC